MNLATRRLTRQLKGRHAWLLWLQLGVASAAMLFVFAVKSGVVKP